MWGRTGSISSPAGATVKLMLASNPSHLEAVNPIVEGMVRARQDLLQYGDAGVARSGSPAMWLFRC